MKQSDKTFLSMYFGAEAILGWNAYDKKTLFDKLAGVFGVDKAAKSALYAVCDNEDVKALHSLEDYMMFMRTLDYEEHYGTRVELPEEVRFAIECKGDAFKALQPLLEDCGVYPTETKLRAAIRKPENSNVVAVAALGAFLCFEGIVFRKDVRKGSELAEKCLRWNNVEGILLLLSYGETSKKEEYLSALVTVTDREGSTEDYASVIGAYEKKGLKAHVYEDAIVLADYLDRHATERPVYDAVVSRIVRSPLIGAADKKRLLSDDGKNAVAAFSDLAVDKREDVAWRNIWDFVAENRKKEAKQMDVGLRKQCSGKVLTPILVCEDAVALHLHEEALLQAVNGVKPVVHIDASRVNKGTFSPTKGNEVVKALVRENTSSAIFVITGADELPEDAAEFLAVMLDAKNKANYTLADANVSVDLSGCAFVLVSATKNVHESLRAQCLFVTVAAASEREKRAYVSGIFATQKSAYECEKLTLGKEAEKMLADKSVEYVYAAIEGVCHEHSYDETNYEVTVQDIENAVNGVYESQMAFVIKK